MEYKLQWIDVKLKIEQQRREEWSRQYHESSASKGKFFYEMCPELLEKPWYAKCRLKNETIRTINRVFTSHTFTKDRLYIMRLSDDNSCDLCGTMESIEHILYEYMTATNTRTFESERIAWTEELH
jgi:hypothetical protein